MVRRTRLHGLSLVAVLGLSVLLLVKVEFRLPNSNDGFYAYGIMVPAAIFVTMLVSFGLYRDPAVTAQSALSNRAFPAETGPKSNPSSHLLVSCLVAVHNEVGLVRQCISSMTSQSYSKIEIIVVDDASSDGTPEVLRELARSEPIRLIELTENVGKKRALTTALLEARGEIIAFSDSDTVWAENAIELIVPVFEQNPNIGAVSGHCRALNGDRNFWTKIQDSWYEGQFSVRKAFESVFGAVTCVSGPLAVFRLDAIFNYMPAWANDEFLGQEFRFATDRTLTAYVLGGSFLGPRVVPKHADSRFAYPAYPVRDWSVVYCKSAKAWTCVPATLQNLVRQQIRWKKSFIRNLFVTGRFYWRRPLLPALLYYLHVGFVLVGPFVAARHLIYMPMRGNWMSMVLYLTGIALIGLSFGFAYRYENPGSTKWLYRPFMSLMSTVMFCWLIFYSFATIKKMTWYRG